MEGSVRLFDWLRGIFAKRPFDWDAWEQELIRQGATPEYARCERLEQQYSGDNMERE